MRSDKEVNNLLFFSHVKETASKQWGVIRVGPRNMAGPERTFTVEEVWKLFFA